MKKSLVLALVLALIFSIGIVPAMAEDQPYILLVNAIVGHPVYEQQAEAARKAAEDYGVNLEIIGPTFGTTTLVNDYLAAMENAITLAPDAIIAEPFDPSLFDVFHRAAEAGIPVFLTSNLLDNEDDFVAWIGTDNFNYGVHAVDMIAQKNDAAQICVVMGNLATTNQVEQREGMEARIAEAYPNMKIVNIVADNNDLATAITETENTLNAYPETNVFVMLESTGGPGVVQACGEQGRDDVLVLDIDAVEATIDNIKAGKVWATLAQNFFKRGYESVRMAYEYLTEGAENVKFEKLNDSGTVLIDASNADTYEEDLWGAITYKGTDW